MHVVDFKEMALVGSFFATERVLVRVIPAETQPIVQATFDTECGLLRVQVAIHGGEARYINADDERPMATTPLSSFFCHPK